MQERSDLGRKQAPSIDLSLLMESDGEPSDTPPASHPTFEKKYLPTVVKIKTRAK